MKLCGKCQKPLTLSEQQLGLHVCESTGGTAAPAGALRYDGDKPKMGLISPIAMKGLADVLTFGAKKYASHNWRKGMDWSRSYDSLLRHLAAWLGGEDHDPESKLPHIDHIACNVMFLQEYRITHPELDDRFKYPKADK